MSLQKQKLKTIRIRYAIIFFVLSVIEVLIALYVHDTIIRPYIGDVLIVVVLYMGIRVLIPEKLKLLPLYIFLFASVVECLQLVNFIQIINVEKNTILGIMIGSVFDIKDIGCYGVGCILLGIYEWGKYKTKNKIKIK